MKKQIFLVSTLFIFIFQIGCGYFTQEKAPVLQAYSGERCELSALNFNIGEKVGVFRVWDMVDTCMSLRFQIFSTEVIQKGIKRVIIEINSPGGLYYDALAIANRMTLLKEMGVEVVTVGWGQIHSAAAVIFLTADKENRFIAPLAKFMIHEVRVEAERVPEEVKKRLEKLQKDLENYLVERTGLSLSKIKDLMGKELNAEEVINLGLAKFIFSE